ncbi:MAG: AtpZ/AtpI family protein [Terriglobales bacterium]|jgi:F0F1-type ATP synthase assembly protein I
MPEPFDPAEKTPPKPDRLVAFARYSEIGFMIPASVLLGLLLGKLADSWLHTRGLYLVGIVLGAVIGFWQMIRRAVGAFKKDE